jgi:hypothetical protein
MSTTTSGGAAAWGPADEDTSTDGRAGLVAQAGPVAHAPIRAEHAPQAPPRTLVAIAEDRARRRCPPQLGRSIVGLIGVDRHIRGAGVQHAENPDVQGGRAALDPDADAVARRDAERPQPDPRRARRR